MSTEALQSLKGASLQENRETSLSARQAIHQQFLSGITVQTETSHSLRETTTKSCSQNQSRTNNLTVSLLPESPSNSSAGSTSSISRLRRLSIMYDEKNPSEHPRAQVQRQFMEGLGAKSQDVTSPEQTHDADWSEPTVGVCRASVTKESPPVEPAGRLSLAEAQKSPTGELSPTEAGKSHTSKMWPIEAGKSPVDSPLSSGMSTPTITRHRATELGDTEKMRADDVDQLLKTLEQRSQEPVGIRIFFVFFYSTHLVWSMIWIIK